MPTGATADGAESYGGFAVQWIRDYDAPYGCDRSIVNACIGTQVVADGPDGADTGAGLCNARSN